MARYYISEESDFGQLLLDLSACAGSLCEKEITKTELVNEINNLIRNAKRVRNLLTHPCNKGYLDPYQVKGVE